ncbi:MAG: sensor histidine kinase [Saccharofermentanales bacterium]|jgi:signal transduction histidine kinase
MKNFINLTLITCCAIITALIAKTNELIVFSIFLALFFYSVLYLIGEHKNQKFARFALPLSYLFFLALIGLDFILPATFAGLPLIVYYYTRWDQLWILFSCFLIFSAPNYNIYAFCLMLINCGFSILLKNLTTSYLSLSRIFIDTVDQNTLTTRTLRRQNKYLLEQQEIEKENSILEERNRIAREIHDNVGHKLTSALVQIGALEYTMAEDEQSEIKVLHATLDEAMEQIRESVHNLHRESISIESILHNLADNYKFCKVDLSVKIEKEPDNNTIRAIMSITREALANTAKHSDADLIRISLSQVANNYILLIIDNGKTGNIENKSGLGLFNIEERAILLGGIANFSTENGFRIFVRLPINNSLDKGKIL